MTTPARTNRDNDPLLGLKQVAKLIGRSRATIYADMEAGRFPRGMKLGAGRGGARRWYESEILSWLEARREGTAA